MPETNGAARRRRASPMQPQTFADKGDHFVGPEGSVLKGRRKAGSPAPRRGRKTPPKAEKRSVRKIATLAAELKRAEDLLARGRKEVRRLRETKPWSPARRLSQLLLANFEALLSLQVTHRGYLLRQLREARGSAGRTSRTHKTPKQTGANGAARRGQKTRTDQASC